MLAPMTPRLLRLSTMAASATRGLDVSGWMYRRKMDTQLRDAPRGDSPPVEVRRSSKRRSTVSARWDGETAVISIPARLSRAQEREWVDKMVGRLVKQRERRRPSDEALAARCAELSRRFLAGHAEPQSVRWVSNQGKRWGSCTVSDGTIRISDRIKGMPQYVVDYVLLHELTHLLHADHGPEFWGLLDGYPHLERAKGFLDGVTYASGEEPEQPRN